MWTIRQEQTDAFRQYHLQKFEDEMVEHLKKFYPQQWKAMGEPDGRRVIRLGIEQAERYGLTNRGPVRFYIELMLMFGSYFDTDLQHPWATAVLKDAEAVDQVVRADRLFAAMNMYLDQVVEPERKHLIEVLQGLTQARIEDYLAPAVNREEAFLQGVLSACPLRSQYLGEPVLRRLIRHAVELARHFGFNSDKGTALMFVLTFVGGHGFYKDPQYGWIARGLDRERCPDAGKRIQELSSKSALYLGHVLAGVNKE
jgi:hypothetical protein